MKFCWVTMMVTNMEETLRFYQEIVGLPVKRRFNPAPGREIVFLGEGETQVELISSQKAQIGPDISLGFEVDSVDDMMKSLNEKGVEIIGGPIKPNPNITFFYVSDPNGVKVQFVEQR